LLPSNAGATFLMFLFLQNFYCMVRDWFVTGTDSYPVASVVRAVVYGWDLTLVTFSPFFPKGFARIPMRKGINKRRVGNQSVIGINEKQQWSLRHAANYRRIYGLL